MPESTLCRKKCYIKKRDHAQATDFYFEVDTSIRRLFVACHVLSSYRVQEVLRYISEASLKNDTSIYVLLRSILFEILAIFPHLYKENVI